MQHTELHCFGSRWGPLHFSIVLILPAALGPGVDSASNRNEYRESSWGKRRPVRQADLTLIPEAVVYKMLEPQRLTTLLACETSYEDSFTFLAILLTLFCVSVQ
jgi:hypothetical protein